MVSETSYIKFLFIAFSQEEKNHLLEENIWGEKLGEVRAILCSGHRSRVWFALFFWLAQPISSWTHHFIMPLLHKMWPLSYWFFCASLLLLSALPGWPFPGVQQPPLPTWIQQVVWETRRLHVQALHNKLVTSIQSVTPGGINSREITGPYTVVPWILRTL